MRKYKAINYEKKSERDFAICVFTLRITPDELINHPGCVTHYGNLIAIKEIY